jgi:Gas vesicle synthesis protein GvpL/GvpF
MPLYVYGLMRADDVAPGTDFAGDKHPIEVVVHKDLAALTSAVEGEPVRLRREAVTSHSDVLQRALERGPVLPLRFGTVVPDADALKRDLLAARREQMRARLDELAGKAEFRLKISYREEPMLRSILAQDPALRRSAESVRGLPAQASHFQRVGLGERIALAVQARRDGDAQQLLSELTPLAVAVEIGALQQPEMALNASFLVSDEMRDRFDQTVERLASERAELMEFKLIGPLPAHSFADGQLGALAVPAAGPTS